MLIPAFQMPYFQPFEVTLDQSLAVNWAHGVVCPDTPEQPLVFLATLVNLLRPLLNQHTWGHRWPSPDTQTCVNVQHGPG